MRTNKTKITITPTTNIDYNKMAVIDNNLVTTRNYDGLNDVFTFYNEKTKEERKDMLIRVSLFDDLIVEGDVKYKILHMLSIG